MNLHRPRVLLAQNLSEAHRAAFSMLETHGYDIQQIQLPQLSVPFLDQNPTDVVFLCASAVEAEVPWETVRTYRIEGSPSHYASFILDCEQVTPQLVDQALQGGFDLVIQRDSNPSVLHAHVHAAAQIAKTRRELADTLTKLTKSNERLKKVSVNDELTGLHNLRYIRKVLRAEFKRAERYNNNLSLLCIDIDNFREINESFDHLMGSYVLSKTGLQIGGSIRTDIDFAARIGADEFLIVLPETHLEGATVVAERIQRRIAETVYDNGTHRVQVSVSYGIANFDGTAGSATITDPDMLQRLAEHNLGLAKQARKEANTPKTA